ncbi:prephenate dehydrogenase [Achromobacter animicus]|uniref:prephenate dehydrogenase n=1 Tax=Achromobacter animicus TaxID=1389935 RepID=UPI0028AC2470|nr:prephenate dehydrogenase/arogenate dehydrogenase family protein [Achromobacter animicus]
MNDALPSSDQGAAGPLIPVLAVVGVGLIGGSFAAALRQAGQVGKVLGVGRNAQSLERAVVLGLIDEAVTAEAAAAQADLIMLATPVGGLTNVLSQMRTHLSPHAVLTDGGSTKAEVVEAARDALGDRIGQFVPGHPIAGAERTGPEAADADLYRGRTVILTPVPENGAAAMALVRQAWQACGAHVIDMDAAAATRLELAGSGFRDFPRIAAGSPEMWRDIFLSNRDAMLAELAAVRGVLDRAERAIADGDGEALLTLLDTAARARRGWRKE